MVRESKGDGVKKSTVLAATAMVLALSGCATPFAEKAAYDTKEHRAPGSISISDGRLYGRELLINERRKDLEWLNDLIEKSKSQTFAPEIAREIEQVSSFAAALGLKFDPAAGVNYRRDKEVSDIQHEIQLVKLQAELAQLQRDLEFFKSKLAEQTANTNSDLGKPSNSSATDLTNGVSAAAADRLNTAMGSLQRALTDRLDKADSPQARLPTSVSVSPFDNFRDLTAYRNLLKSERNAVVLDELHDQGGASLYRINFLATVVPDPRYKRSLGLVQMQPKSAPADDGYRNFLLQWVGHLNSNPRDRDPSGAIVGDAQIRELETRGFVSRMWAEVGASPQCRGIIQGSGITINPGCRQVELFIPVSKAGSKEIVTSFKGIEVVPGRDEHRPFFDAIGALDALRVGDPARLTTAVQYLCGPRIAIPEGQIVLLARDFAQSLQRDSAIFETISAIVEDAGFEAGGLQRRIGFKAGGAEFLENIDQEMAKVPECNGIRSSTRGSAQSSPLWANLRSELGRKPVKIRVYDVGPREQAQQLSTVARSANSLALAASIAASAPGSGAAGEAAASYSRQAMGRAQALERVPTVVGYASTSDGQQSGNVAFGWVFGPRARVDPKGRVDTEQVLKAHDVSVDLIAPSWITAIEFDAKSMWGPSPSALAGGSIVFDEGADGIPISRKITIELPKRSGDYDNFTEFLLGPKRELASRVEVEGMVSACEESYLTVRGTGLWRTTQAIVMGRLVQDSDISVLPSMDGVLIKVPKIDLPKGSLTKKTIALLSPYDVVTEPVEYQAQPAGEECKPKPAAATAPADTKTPKFVSYQPERLDFAVPSNFTITIAGENLGNIDAVTLNGQKAELKVGPEGKSLRMSFTPQSTSGIPGGIVLLKFFEAFDTPKQKEVHSVNVRIERHGGI